VATAVLNPKALRGIDWRHPGESLNPVFVKEIRQGLRAKGFVGPFTLIHVCLMIGLGLELLETAAIGTKDTFGPIFFWTIVCVFLLVALPFVGLGSISREVKGHHVELFRLAGITRWRIVLGKWLALFLQSLLIVISIIPYILLRYLIGGMELLPNLGWLLLVLVQSGNVIALTLALSSFRSTMGRLFGMLYLPFTLAQNLGASATMLIMMGYTPDFLHPFIFVIYGGLATFGSIVILLSIASGKIQLFERTYGGDKGNSLVLLYAATPYIVGFAGAITFGIGMPAAWLFLAWVAGKHQATRDGDIDLLYTSRRLQTVPLKWGNLPPEGPERLAYLRAQRAQMLGQANDATGGGQVGAPTPPPPEAPAPPPTVVKPPDVF
jgi:ABC-type transport system involved in multi-copper enzyme maturation permease subunit